MTDRSAKGARAVAAVLFALAVLAADVALVRVFLAERSAARDSVTRERGLVERSAAVSLERWLEGELERAQGRLASVEADPLLDEEGIVLVENGALVLPRHPGAPERPRESDGARDDEGDRDLASLSTSVAASTTAPELEHAVRRFLEHRAHRRPSAAVDVEATLRVAEVLADRPDADPALVRALLIAGMNVGPSRIEPVAASVLRLHAEGDGDAEPAGLRLVALCRAASVDCARFEKRWEEMARPLPVVPTAIDGPRFFPSTGLYVEPGNEADPHAQVVGVLLGPGWRERVMEVLSGEARLLDDDRLELLEETGAVRAVLQSQRLEGISAAAERSFVAKSALLGVMNVMAAALVAAVLLERARRRRYEALRSQFVAAVSHELRTPLASMRLLVESMLARTEDAKARERLERLGSDVDGLDFLVENILSFTRLERGRLSPRLERVSLAEVAADVVARARAEAPGVTIDLDEQHAGVEEGPDARELDVLADPELLALVVHNLVRNAWQHNTRVGTNDKRARVRVERGGPSGVDDALARVIVEDNGGGVPEGERERIFGEFERGARASSRGTGLGLALCRQIARAHGGDVVLASTGPAGSTFVMTMPVGARSGASRRS